MPFWSTELSSGVIRSEFEVEKEEHCCMACLLLRGATCVSSAELYGVTRSELKLNNSKYMEMSIMNCRRTAFDNIQRHLP